MSAFWISQTTIAAGTRASARDYSPAIGYDWPIVPRTEHPPIVGLSSNVLESSAAFGRPDGIGTYTRELERALVRAGITVRRVGAPVRAGVRLVQPVDASIAFPLPLPYLAAAAAVTRTPVRFASAVESTIDLYHATDYMVPRLPRTPVVATVHDAIPITHPEWANPRLRRVKNWLLRNCVRSADLVIAISRAVVDELVDAYGIPRERIRVVPLGVDARWFLATDDAGMRQALRARNLQPGYFLHVGTLQPRKNLDTLVSAYQQLPDGIRSERQLVLVGKYGWAADMLRHRLESLRAENRVVWVDYVDRDELQALYRGAGAFVFPSLAEGFGLPLLEALATGLRVIASDTASSREVAEHHARYVDPRGTDALADAMARVHFEADDADALIARQDHARRFNWEVVAARTCDVYREMA